MTDLNRKVLNPLFNVSVTGSTVEDYTQHALLLPAKAKSPPPPVLNLSQGEPSISQETSEFLEVLPETIDTFQNNPPINLNYQPNYQQPPNPQQQSSNLSSVFSSFSNILKLKSNSPTPELNVAVPPPAGIEALISQDYTNVEPVPLFPSTGLYQIPQTIPQQQQQQQGPVNTFRRTGIKRPVYAQVPGLSTSTTFQRQSAPPPQPPVSLQTSSPATSVSSNYPKQLSHSNSSPLLEEFTPTDPNIALSSNYFTNTSTSQSLPVQQTVHSLSNTTPVMAEIPPNEIMQETSNFHSTENDFTSGFDGLSTKPTTNNQIYRPVYHHWFHKKEIEGKVIWDPFSMVDSLALDAAFTSNDLDPDKVVATDGGRFDVNILRRQRTSVYWTGPATEVRRCSWFHKGSTDGRFVPYEENIATKLEDELKMAYESKQWNRKVELSNGESVVFHGPDVLVLYPATQSPDAWGNTPNQLRPKIVKRGMDEFNIDEGEPTNIDHLLFLVHGIGSVCDLRFRSVEEVVDEFRSISLQLVQSHYRSSCEKGIANRVEVLPISWHQELHSEDTGIDRKLKSITLDSIPRLRDFTNDTLLDILFYTSPVYCQKITSTVGDQMNKIYDLFMKRNPNFKGGVSLGGHSLGSLIVFDLLCHQHPEPDRTPPTDGDEDVFPPISALKPPPPLQRRMSRRISYMMGSVGTGQPQIHYPHLTFQPKAFFALGSPIGMFVTVRGLDNLGTQFALPTCPAFFNIFHPYDPVAYRVESLINPELSTLKPVLIPHHKGRKRIHLELRETMARVGADFKQKVIDSMKSTWNSVYQLAMFHRQDQPSSSLEEEVEKAIKEQLKHQNAENEETPDESEQQQQAPTDLHLGLLNSNRRIDYVLQETPFEFFNEYIFALTSHVCYWESEDTMLMILKEIYSSMDIATDDKIPQQTMTIERHLVDYDAGGALGSVDPTVGVQKNVPLAPPPTSGFIKKT